MRGLWKVLGNLLDRRKSRGGYSLVDRLEESYKVRPDKGGAGPPRKGSWLRCSSLPKMCARMYGLAMFLEKGLALSGDAELGWVLTHGTATHRELQENHLRNLPEGVFQGWWRDKLTGVVHRGETLSGGSSLPHRWIPQPEGVHEYVELAFSNLEYRITGHCDGVLCWPNEAPEILEIKTINDRGFDRVNPWLGGRPKDGHVIQVQAYMWLSGLKRARILYVNKTHDRGKLFKELMCEHVVERDDDRIESVKSLIKSVIEVVDGGEYPVERLSGCRIKSARRAKHCPMKAECFAG